MEVLAARTFVGIDVAKDASTYTCALWRRAFALSRDDAGLEALVERLVALAPALVVLEATGGFEVAVAGALAAAGLPWSWSTPGRSATSLGPPGDWPRPIAWMPRRSRALPRPSNRRRDRCRAPRRSLGELVARRRQLVEMITSEASAAARRATALGRRLEAHLDWLHKELSASRPTSTTRSAAPAGAPRGLLASVRAWARLACT